MASRERAFREDAPMGPTDQRLDDESEGRRRLSVAPFAAGDTYVLALQRSAALIGENMRSFQDEAARFMNRRMERDLETMEDIARSRSLLELFGVQQKWLSGVAGDYGDEMIRLARLAGNTLEDSVAATNRMRDR